MALVLKGGLMALSRGEVVSLLRSVGLAEVADKVRDELPEHIEVEELIRFGSRYGITRDWLISRMGGSP
jgi:hypothetical protein